MSSQVNLAIFDVFQNECIQMFGNDRERKLASERAQICMDISDFSFSFHSVRLGKSQQR